MTRADLLTYLQNKFTKLASDTGQATTDTANGYGPALDNALRSLGFSESQLAAPAIADADILDLLSLADYYALKNFAAALAIRVSINLDGDAKSRQQAFQQTKVLLDMAREDCKEKGLIGSSGWQAGTIMLDFLEPGCQYD